MQTRLRVLAVLLTAMMMLPEAKLFANVLGSDAQQFNATTNGLDFVTVHSSETLRPGVWNFGFFMNYAANTLPFLDTEAARYGKVRDSVTAADFNMGVGLFPNFDIGVSFPFVVKQVVNSSDDRGEFENTGNTEFRANMKYRFFGNNQGGGALIVSGNLNRVEDNPYSGLDAGPTVNYELAFDGTLGGFGIGVNVGYRDRKPGEQVPEFDGLIAPIEDQYIYSLAMSYYFESINLKFITEAFAAQPVETNDNDISRSQTSAEYLAGIKYDVNHNVALHFGTGSEIAHAIGTPDYRIYAGINVTTGGAKKPKLVKKKKKRKKKAPPPPPEPDPLPEEPEIVEEGGPGDEVFVLRDVNFLFDSDTQVLAGAKDEMARLAERLTAQGYSKIIIEGHTDSFGNDDYNMTLGQKRADAIRNYLIVNHKMDASKIEAQSYGETKPIASNGNYQGRQLNRRVVFRVFY